mgnify:CR=1 FL=1
MVQNIFGIPVLAKRAVPPVAALFILLEGLTIQQSVLQKAD